MARLRYTENESYQSVYSERFLVRLINYQIIASRIISFQIQNEHELFIFRMNSLICDSQFGSGGQWNSFDEMF